MTVEIWSRPVPPFPLIHLFLQLRWNSQDINFIFPLLLPAPITQPALHAPLNYLFWFSLQSMGVGAPGPLGRPARSPVLEGSVNGHVFATAQNPSMVGRTVWGM